MATMTDDIKINDLHIKKTLYNSSNPTRRSLHISRYKWVCDAINRYTKNKDINCIEIGIGSGIYIPALQKVSFNVYITDIEESNLDHAREKYNGINYQMDDITSSNFSNEFFDLILFSEVIEHIRESERALFEIQRILKPNGILILTTPQKHCPLEQIAKIVSHSPFLLKFLEIIYKEPIPDFKKEHINLMTDKQLLKQINKTRLKILESYKCGLYILFIAEFLGENGKNFIQKIEQKIRNSKFNWLLWTQCYILKLDI